MSSVNDDPLLRDLPEIEGHKVLDRRYVIYDTLGQGGMGVVYRARHLDLDLEVAIKCLDPTLARRDPQFVTRFKQEAKAAARVDDPNTVRVYDVAEASGVHYISMQFVAGESARDRVTRKGPLAVEEAMTIALGVAKGLAAAHRKGLIHRDVKPANILVSAEGEVKLADLGLAKIQEDSGMTYSGASMGTPRYMPPEQFGDAKNVGPQADVYSLGATLYFLLVGEDGVGGNSLIEVADRVRAEPFPVASAKRPDVPAALDELIARCVAKDPAERPADGSAMVRELEEALAGAPSDLEDDMAGQTLAVETLVSPPPAQTLASIRVTLAKESQSPASAPAPAEEPVATPVPRPARRAKRGTRRRPQPRPKRSRWGLLLVGLAAIVVVLFGWEDWFPSGTSPGSGSAATTPSPAAPVELAGSAGLRGSVAIEVDPPLRAGERVFVAARSLSLAGRVVNPVAAELRVIEDREFTKYPLDASGEFEVERALRIGATHRLELSSEGLAEALELEVVQDGERPEMEVVQPAANDRSTAKETIDFVVRASDANLSSVRLGTIPLELEEDGWTAKGVALSLEGANAFELVAEDLAGNTTHVECVIERDTVPPTVVSIVPTPNEILQPDSKTEFEVELSEPGCVIRFHGETIQVEGTTAVIYQFIPPFEEWEVRLDVCDGLANCATESFMYRVEGKPTSASLADSREFEAALEQRGDLGWYTGRYFPEERQVSGKPLETNRALERALKWLVEHQSTDGRWDADGFAANCSALDVTSCGGKGDASYDVGVTGLALLALMGDGNTASRGPHQKAVRSGLFWLLGQQDPDYGLVGSEEAPDFIYNHAIATQALSEAAYFLGSSPVRSAAEAAVGYVERARNPYGAWRYDVPPLGDNDTSVTGWMILALFAAKEAGIRVPDHAIQGGLDWIEEVSDATAGRVGYTSIGSRSSRAPEGAQRWPSERGEALTSIAVLCRLLGGQGAEQAKIISRHVDVILSRLPEWGSEDGSCDMYYWYYGSQAMHQVGGSAWQKWHTVLLEAVLEKQRTGADAEGSWDPAGPWGESGGRVYSTAMMALSLEAPYRYARGSESR